MTYPRPVALTGLALFALLLAGCEEPTARVVTTTPQPATPQAPATVTPVDPASLDPTNPIEEAGIADGFGEPEVPLLGGYRNVNDPCRRAGESRFTRRFLDDSADLVACLRGGGAERSLAALPGATAVAQTPSYTLFSVPRGDVAG